MLVHSKTMRFSATKRWLLYAMLVWLGGLSCLAGCLAQTHAAAIPSPPAPAASHEENCTDGCCKKKGHSEHAPAPQHSNEQSCCTYLNIPAATVTKSSVDAAPPVEAPRLLEQPGDVFSDTLLQAESHRLDSCPTHLRNCILRI